MASENMEKWDLYDYLDFAERQGWKRRCPKCGGVDVKYALHSQNISGCELSVRCNDCREEDTGNNSGEDVRRLVYNWHDQTKVRS